jgi:anion-transporting  ArsA/GET3 family ATPase
VDEAVHFAAKLADAEMSVTALIVNRVQPRFIDDRRLEELQARVESAPGDGGPLRVLVDNLAGYAAASDRDEQVYGDLVARIAPAPVSRVPLLNSDVHDLDGLGLIADLLFRADGPATPPVEFRADGPAAPPVEFRADGPAAPPVETEETPAESPPPAG